jgi:RND family efflux transporter MFP subunit
MNSPSTRRAGGSLAVAFIALTGCGPGAPPVADVPPPPVTVSQPLVRDVTDFDDYEGRIGAAQKVEVRARVRGHLVKVNFEDGQLVKKGALLYEIDPRPYKATLDAAEAQKKAAEAALQFAQAEFARTRALAAKGAAAAEEVETWIAKQAVAKGDALKAAAAVEQAQLDLDFCKVTSPLAGRISRTQVDEGNLINASGGETLLTTITSVDPMYVYFDVDERALLRYRRDPRRAVPKDGELPPIKDLKIPVLVGLEGETGYPHKGLLDFADNKVNPGTGTIQVRGVLSNSSRVLDDGMRARVRIPVSEPYKAVMITERAVGSEQGRKFVYVVNDKDVVEQRDVTLDRVFDGLVVVRDGVKEGEWVIVNGIQRVRPGVTVKPQQVPMPGSQQPAAPTQPTGK